MAQQLNASTICCLPVLGQHRKATGRRIQRRSWLTSWLYVLPVLCLALPFIYWQTSSLLLPTPSAGLAELTPLQRLQQQKARGLEELSGRSRSISSVPADTKAQEEAAAPAGSPPPTTVAEINAAQKYLDSIQYPKPRPAVNSWTYVIDPEPWEMRRQRLKVQEFLKSEQFSCRTSGRQKCKAQRGIILNAGGPQLVSSAIVSIKVLREQLGCTLPIELVWHTDNEMDMITLNAIQHMWGNITGVDLSRSPWPAHHRSPPIAPGSGVDHTNTELPQDEMPAERALKQRAFMYKVWSLATTSFQQALLLDADNLPLFNPEVLFEDPSFQVNGNLFWPDFWPPGTSQEAAEVVYDIVGLDAKIAAELLAAGKGPGMSWRGTESGQLLLDLVRHGDVAEWALWINSFGDSVYRGLWGDKDTYALAFGVAGKAQEFNQVQVPPAGAFSWRPKSVLVKDSGQKVDGWQLAGMVQYDAWGQPAFLHRTMNKFSYDGDPWQIGLLTAPLQLSWIQYYLSLDALGPTVGVPVTYAAPSSAFDAPEVQIASAAAAADGKAECPAAAFQTYHRLRQQAVPIGPISALDTACNTLLTYWLGSLASRYTSARLRGHPQLLGIGAQLKKNAAQPEIAGYGYVPTQQPDSTPVLAWQVPAASAAEAGRGVDGMAASPVMVSIQAGYDALEWVKQRNWMFPLLSTSRATHQDSNGGNSRRHEL